MNGSWKRARHSSNARRRRYTFCQVVAGLGSLFMPFGTVLGVFTLIVLARPAVRELFRQESTAVG